MSLESTVAKLATVERQIDQRLRELRVLISLRRILRRKLPESETPNGNTDATKGVPENE